MNNDEFLQVMKQENDEAIKDDEKIQQFLVWLYEKTTSLASPYQEAALRYFYCDVVEGIISDHYTSSSNTARVSLNREISRLLDSNLDKDIDEARGVGLELCNSAYDGITYNSSKLHRFELRRLIYQAETLPAVKVAFDKDVAIACKQPYKNYMMYPTRGYLGRAIALLVRSSDFDFRRQIIYIMDTFPSSAEWGSGDLYEKRLEEWRQRLSSCLYQRNLKLDWPFSDEQKQLLNKYYVANKLLVDLLQENRASPEVQKDIQDTLLLPIVEIERRKSGSKNKKILLDCPQEIHAIPEVKETQDTWLLPTVEIEESSSNEVQQQAQKMLPSPIDKIAQYRQENNQGRPKSSIKIDYYTKPLLYSSLLIALMLYIVFITVFK